MKIDLYAKVAAFCRELSDDTLRDMARAHAMDKVFQEAGDLLKAGQIGRGLEGKLDELDEMVRQAEGQGFYPAATRGGFAPLPDSGGDTGARWWTCPRGWCAGRGLVRRGQAPPVCQAAGEQLLPEPLPE